MDFNAVLKSLMQLHNTYGGQLDAGLLIFTRLIGFLSFGPIIGRRDIPINMRIAVAIFFTIALLPVVPLTTGTPDTAPRGYVGQNDAFGFMLALIMNATVGTFLGFASDLIMKTIGSAGSMMNNQVGLSSAMMFDPTSRSQVMLLEKLFTFLGTLLFIQIGGFTWILGALRRSFDLFPLYHLHPDFSQTVDLGTLIHLSGDTITMGVQLVAPVMVVTIAIDLILGIMNRTAQQIPVFQLSFAVKPCIGISVLIATLPLMVNAMAQYLKQMHQFL